MGLLSIIKDVVTLPVVIAEDVIDTIDKILDDE